jgi:hypothetical protein
MNLDHIIYLLV